MLVEKLDAEDLDAWGQVVGWLKWKVDGMLVEKIFGDSGVRGMKWYAVGKSSWEK